MVVKTNAGGVGGEGREEAGRARRCFVVLRESERERARVVGRRREADSSGRSGWRPGPSGSRARPSVCHVYITCEHKRGPFGFSVVLPSCDCRIYSRAGVKTGSQSATRQIMRMPQAGNNGCPRTIIIIIKLFETTSVVPLFLSFILAPLPLVPGWSCCSRIDCAVACLQLSSEVSSSLVRFSLFSFLCPPLVPLLFLHSRV